MTKYKNISNPLDKFYYIIYTDIFYEFLKYLLTDEYQKFEYHISLNTYFLFRMIFLLRESLDDFALFIEELTNRNIDGKNGVIQINYASYNEDQKINYDLNQFSIPGSKIGNMNRLLNPKNP